jgi:hypothetical protein
VGGGTKKNSDEGGRLRRKKTRTKQRLPSRPLGVEIA